MRQVIIFLFCLVSIGFSEIKIDPDFIFKYPRIWGNTPMAPCWSYDDSRIAFLWNDKGGESREVFTVYLPSGRPAKRTNFFNSDSLITDSKISCLKWFPKSNRLLFVYNNNIFTLLVENNKITSLNINCSVEIEPEISPDEKYLVYNKDSKTYLYSFNEKQEIPLEGQCLSSKHSNCKYQWSSNSQKFAIQKLFITDENLALCEGIYFYNTQNDQDILSLIPFSNNIFLRNFIWADNDNTIIYDYVSNNLKSRLILSLSIESGVLDTLYSEEASNWIPEFGSDLYINYKENKLIFGSSKMGYPHIFSLDLKTKNYDSLTRGHWDILDFHADKQGNNIFFRATKDSPVNSQIYKINLLSKKIKTVSYQSGTHNFTLSHSGKKMANIFSNSSHSPELYYSETIPQSKMIKLTRSPLFNFRDYKIRQPEYKSINVNNFKENIHYKLWLPESNLTQNKFPLIVCINNNFDSEYTINRFDELSLFNQLLSEKGFVVAQMNCTSLTRFAAENKKNFLLRLINRQKAEISAVTEHLGQNGFVDGSEIGLFGWGYNGFLISEMLLEEPEMFKVGVVLSGYPVWDKVQTSYQSAIYQNLTKDDSLLVFSDKLTLSSNLLFLQSPKNNISNFFDSNLFVKKMIYNRSKVDFIFYHWEKEYFSKDVTNIDIAKKVCHYFRTNLYY